MVLLALSSLTQVTTVHVGAPGMAPPMCLGSQLGDRNGLSSSTWPFSLHGGRLSLRRPDGVSSEHDNLKLPGA